MATAAKRRLTAREYLALERKAETRSEFIDGEMFAMAGGTRRHSLLAANLIGELCARLKGKPCQVLTNDMRIKVEATGLYAYPDAQVACGRLSFEDPTEDVLLNPKIIFEVLSPSTATWDRGKFAHYRQIESLTDYVLVWQEAWLIEHFIRQAGDTWRVEILTGAKAVLSLTTIKVRVPLKEIYSNSGLKAGVLPPEQFPETYSKR